MLRDLPALSAMHPFPLSVSTPDRLAYRLLQDSDWARSAAAASAPPELRTLLAMILDSPEPLWIAWGHQDKTFFFNDAYLPMLGGKLHGAMGNGLEQVWADVWQVVAPAIDDAFAGTSRSFNNLPLMMDRDGTLRETFWTFSYSPLRVGSGAVAGIICVVSEQTERVIERDRHSRQVAAITEQAREAHLELVRAREQLRQSQKLEAIGQLTGGVAHDFNNLLTIIRSSAELLGRRELPRDKQKKYIDAIAETADRAAKLTSQLLAFARRQALKPEVFNATTKVGSVAEMLRTVVGSRIDLVVDPICSSCFVEVDASQFETALVNMAVNARDAMNGEGRMTIAIEAAGYIPARRGHAAAKGDFVKMSVTDSGSGISPEQLDHIFEPFFTTKDVGKGTGLGLSQVYGFTKQSGGEIDVESHLGKGTTFSLYLPRTSAPNAAETILPPELVAAAEASILIVEDNDQVGEFASHLLSDLGFTTRRAANAGDALAILEKEHRDIDILFSDVIMPGIDGVELGRQIRARWPALTVVLTSGYSHVLADDARHGFALLHKPYSVDELSRVLRDARQANIRSPL